MTAEAIVERSRAHRRHALYTQGLGRLEPVLWAIADLQTALSPKSTQDLSRRSPLALDKRLQQTSASRAPVRLNLSQHVHSDQPQVNFLVPSSSVADYCVGVANDDKAADPLGMRSLYGILDHYDIARVAIQVPADRRAGESGGVVDLRAKNYARRFRLKDRRQAQLRSLIDRALWGGERLWLDREMVDCYSRIAPERQDFLTEMGLILLPDEAGRFELFVPGAFSKRDAQVSTKQLNQIVVYLDRCLRTSADGQQFFLRQDAACSTQQRLFNALTQQGMLDSQALKQRLEALAIRYRVSPNIYGSNQYIEFYREANGAQIEIPKATPAMDSPSRRGAMAPGAEAPVRGSPVPAASPVARELPRPLFCLANHVLITGKAQPIPSDERYHQWLRSVDIVDALGQLGLGVALSDVAETGGAKFTYLAPLNPRQRS
ncbi:MAG: hypothetical protein ACFCBW_21700 [Candidatus Competibacterales bacterium]